VGSCVKNQSTGQYVCAAPTDGGKTIFGSCDPHAWPTDGCPADTFCKDYSACSPDGIMQGGHCSTGVGQGAPCDTDWLTPSTGAPGVRRARWGTSARRPTTMTRLASA
jgi:hypothetical protein